LPAAQFPFGQNLEHEFRVVVGWLGRERYYANGHLLRSSWSLLGSKTNFATCGHDIRIELGLSSDWRRYEGKAFVNGVCVQADLFAHYNDMLASWRHSRKRLSSQAWWGRVMVWAGVGFAAYQLLIYISRRAA
jgi:hypothetical protein